MADAELKVRIDAEIKGFSTALKQGERELSGFSTKVNSELNKTAAAAASASAKLGGAVAQGTDRAAFALTNLGRVAQDAPFGFIGIQNNLNPLLESFQQLKQSTGTTGGALKALGQSLIGPAGLGLALSVVSAGILFYQQYQQKANKEVATAKKVTDEYINSLGQLDQAKLKGAQSSQAEIADLTLLFQQYSNTSNSIASRKEAYDELQRIYPAYFGNLKFENEISAKTTSAYNKLSEAILASGRARAASELIAKNSSRQLENEQKVIDLTTQITKEQTRQKQLQGAVESQNLLAKQEANILTSKQKDILDEYLKSQGKEQALTKLKNNLLTDSNILTDKNLQLTKSVNQEIAKGGQISGNVGGQKPKTGTDKAKKDADELLRLTKDLKNAKLDNYLEGLEIAFKLAGQGLENFKDKFPKDTKKTFSSITDTPLIPLDGLLKAKSFVPDNFGKELYGPFAEFKDVLSQDILPQLGSSFQNFFDDILKNGEFSFQALGGAILNTFRSVLASEATKGLLSLLTGGAGGGDKKGGGLFPALLGGFGKLFGKGAAAGGAGTVASGAGAAAGGSLLLPILGGLAAGGIIASLFKKKQKAPTPAVSTTTTSSPATSGVDFGGGSVVFQISGTNLIGVLNRAGQKLQRYGG
jgi:hypothetical protein